MNGMEHFARLLDEETLPRRLDLVQLSSCWREDPDWIALRDRIDALIFSQLLVGAPLTVRRIVRLEIPSEERGKAVVGPAADREHRRWVDGLVGDLYHLGEPQKGDSARYRIRQLILGQEDDAAVADMEDGWSGDFCQDPEWSKAFSTTWSLQGCIENNLVPADYPVGPAGDRDPRWYLLH